MRSRVFSLVGAALRMRRERAIAFRVLAPTPTNCELTLTRSSLNPPFLRRHEGVAPSPAYVSDTR